MCVKKRLSEIGQKNMKRLFHKRQRQNWRTIDELEENLISFLFALQIHFVRQNFFEHSQLPVELIKMQYGTTKRQDWLKTDIWHANWAEERERYLTQNIGFSGFYFVRAKSIAFSIRLFIQNLKFMQQINKNNVPVWVAYVQFFPTFYDFPFLNIFFISF